MAKAQSQQAFDNEQKVIEKARQETPELFVATPKEPDQLFKQVGIMNTPTDLPKGYFKYRPEDFIVEEIRPDGNVITVDGKDPSVEESDGEGTIYFDMTKVGISTLDAENKIQEITGHPEKDIGRSGIKDAVALTSQRMSLRNGILNEVLMLDLPGTIIRNVHEAKGVVTAGNLKGNRFTLMIRTDGSLDEAAFKQRIQQINEKGIMNYFGIQRFGTPRFIAHLVGREMLINGAEAGVKSYMTQPSAFELPFFAQKRERALAKWGDWKGMQAEFQDCPYSFRHELEMLKTLISSKGHFKTTLESVGQQAGMWVRAYASYATNELLSAAEKQGVEMPDKIPQLLNPNPETLEVYQTRLKRDGLGNPMGALKKYEKFIRVGSNPTMQPVIRPEIHQYKMTPEGVAICFSLPKGAYATTMLMYLFDTATGYPIPEWLKTDDVDTKELLGMGSLKEIKAVFAPEISRIMKRKTEDKQKEA